MQATTARYDFLKGRIVLITGGTGSFGNSVLRDLIGSEVAQVRIFSRDEEKQHAMRSRYSTDRVRFYIGDVRDRRSLTEALQGSEYVFHAAALKQVPSCEFHPMEAVKTNVLGTENVLSEAVKAGVKGVVVLSTDKAAYPINAMGMTKALMEKLVVARASTAADQGCTLCITRYGNVMASRGSVIPLFVRQIQEGRPLTVTDPRMTRFMMTLDEAVDLVIHAFREGRPGDLFVRKAPAATLGELAESVKRVYGADNPIVTIGTRHGEKSYETLVTKEERTRAKSSHTYFRIPMDARDLNYDRYVSQGIHEPPDLEDYNSNNARRLSAQELDRLVAGVLGEEVPR